LRRGLWKADSDGRFHKKHNTYQLLMPKPGHEALLEGFVSLFKQRKEEMKRKKTE
jgi:hypothetical protein